MGMAKEKKVLNGSWLASSTEFIINSSQKNLLHIPEFSSTNSQLFSLSNLNVAHLREGPCLMLLLWPSEHAEHITSIYMQM